MVYGPSTLRTARLAAGGLDQPLPTTPAIDFFQRAGGSVRRLNRLFLNRGARGLGRPGRGAGRFEYLTEDVAFALGKIGKDQRASLYNAYDIFPTHAENIERVLAFRARPPTPIAQPTEPPPEVVEQGRRQFQEQFEAGAFIRKDPFQPMRALDRFSNVPIKPGKPPVIDPFASTNFWARVVRGAAANVTEAVAPIIADIPGVDHEEVMSAATRIRGKPGVATLLGEAATFFAMTPEEAENLSAVDAALLTVPVGAEFSALLRILPASGKTGISGAVNYALDISQAQRIRGAAVAARVPVPERLRPAVNALVEAIGKVTPIREATEATKTIELGRRAKMAARASRYATGQSGFTRRVRPQFAGELPKGEYDPVTKFMTQQDFDSLFTYMMRTADDQFTVLDVGNALNALGAGALPTRSQIAVLEKVFGKQVGAALLRRRPLYLKIGENLLDTVNIVRAINTSFDISAPFRQGAVLAIGEFPRFTRAFIEMTKALVSEKAAIASARRIRTSPNSKLYRKYNLSMTDREEVFATRFTEAIPGIRQSSRAYTTFLNELRTKTFDHYVRLWKGTGKSKRDYKELALFINRATGRGGLGHAEAVSTGLNAVFFAPRLITGRLLLPLSLLSSTNAVRRIAAKNLVSFAVAGMGGLALISKIPGVDVEMDARSSDFGKIRIGNTRIDFWAGFQPYARTIWQLVRNERMKTGADGSQPIGLNRLTTILRLGQSKLSPAASFTIDLLRKETIIGDELSLEEASLKEQAWNRLMPFALADLRAAIKEEGALGVLYGAPGLVGASVQTFKGIRDIQAETALELFPFEFERLIDDGTIDNERQFYDALDQGQRRVVNEHPDVKRSIEDIEDEPDPQVRISAAFDTWAEFEGPWEASLLKKLEADPTGQKRWRTISDSLQERFNARESIFSSTVATMLSESETELRKQLRPVRDVLAERYWGFSIPEHPVLGLDFDALAEHRQKVLDEGDDIDPSGKTRRYILGTRTEDYRGQRFNDPEVRAAIEEREQFVQKLTDAGYWNYYRETPQWKQMEASAPVLAQMYEDYRNALRAANTGGFFNDLGDDAAIAQQVISKVAEWTRDGKLALRQQDPSLDVDLVEWFGSVPVTREGMIASAKRFPPGSRVQELLVDDFQSRIGGDDLAILVASGIRTLEDITRISSNEIRTILNTGRRQRGLSEYRSKTVRNWNLPVQARAVLDGLQEAA